MNIETGTYILFGVILVLVFLAMLIRLLNARNVALDLLSEMGCTESFLSQQIAKWEELLVFGEYRTRDAVALKEQLEQKRLELQMLIDDASRV